MKRILAVLLLFATPVFAQSPDPDPRVTALEQRIKAMEQKQTVPPPTKAQKAANRNTYVKFCDNRGLRFKELHTDAVTGNTFIVCH
jgi:hypothetical protein